MRWKWLAHGEGYQVKLVLMGLVLLFLPWEGVLAQSFSALDFRKLLIYTKGKPGFSVLDELASQKKPPLYLVVVPPQQDAGAGTDGDEKSPHAGSSTYEASQVLSIYKGKWDSSIPDATAIFIQNRSGDTSLMAALSRILDDQPPELFDGDLVILDSEDLEDLRRIVRINRNSPFVTTKWEQKAFLLTSIHSTQLTLITGMKRGSHGMTIIHCFQNTAGPMPAIEVGPDKQEAVRGLIEVLRSGLIPVNVRVNLEGAPYPLGIEELDAIYPALSLNLEKGDKTTRLEQILARQLDKKTGQVTLLAQIPRDILREGSLSISLESDRFMFIDKKSRRRVSEIPIDDWLGSNALGVRPTSVKVARKFEEKGARDDLRYYVIPQEIVEALDRPDCRELFAGVSENRRSPQGAQGEVSTIVGKTLVKCSALGYLDAVVREIQIARELTAGEMKVSVVLDEPPSRWVSPARQRTRDAAVAIGRYLETEAKASGLTVEEMIRVGPQSPSEGGIEIRLAE